MRFHDKTLYQAGWLLLAALSFVLTACNQGSGTTPRAVTGRVESADAAQGRTLLFVGQATEPAVTRSMDDYVQNMGKTPAGFMFYLILSGDVQRTRNELATMQAFMEKHPGTALQLAVGYGPELTGNVKESLYLLAGGFDPELASLAQWLKSLAYPVLLRPLYEFDRGCATYGPAELYKPAYRYIVDALRKAEVVNVRYVWQSAGPGYTLNNGGMNALLGAFSQRAGGALDAAIENLYPSGPEADFCPIANFYPGDGYVDFFAVSYWGDGGVFGQGSEASRANYQLEVRKQLDAARRMGLKLMIAESTPAFIGTTSGETSRQWMKEYFDLIEAYDIRVVSYIATQWLDEGGNWGSPLFAGFFPADARIHADPQIAAIWRQRTASARYVQQGDADVAALLDVKIQPAGLPWHGTAEPSRPRMRWPDCPPPLLPGTGGWCLPVLPGL